MTAASRVSLQATHAQDTVFHCHVRYYSQLWAQQNMLQDAVRTGAYHSAGEGGGT